MQNSEEFKNGVNGYAGNDQGGGTPSIEDLFLVSEKTNPNVVLEMITTSSKAEQFIPRSHLTRSEALSLQRLQIMWSVWHDRKVDMPSIIWNRMAYSIAEEGRRPQPGGADAERDGRPRKRNDGRIWGRQQHDMDTGGR